MIEYLFARYMVDLAVYLGADKETAEKELKVLNLFYEINATCNICMCYTSGVLVVWNKTSKDESFTGGEKKSYCFKQSGKPVSEPNKQHYVCQQAHTLLWKVKDFPNLENPKEKQRMPLHSGKTWGLYSKTLKHIKFFYSTNRQRKKTEDNIFKKIHKFFFYSFIVYANLRRRSIGL